MQYLPHLIAIHLGSVQNNERKSYKFLETFLLAVYNNEALETTHNSQLSQYQQQQSNTAPATTASAGAPVSTVPLCLRVPGLGQNSIFHDSHKLELMGMEKPASSTNVTASAAVPTSTSGGSGHQGMVFMAQSFKPVKAINAATRPGVLQLLFRAFNRLMADVSKYGIDQIARLILKILEQGGSHKQKQIHLRRIFLHPNVLIELLHVAYFCIYNGFQMFGNRMVELIDERAAANAWPSVLVVCQAVKRLTNVTGGPTHVGAWGPVPVSTPGPLAKNMITNASFRTKKMGDDIPKVLTNEEEANFSRMMSICEESAATGNPVTLEDLTLEKTPTKAEKEVKESHTSKFPNKEKIMAKLPNLNVTIRKKDRLNSERDSVGKDEATPPVKDSGGAERPSRSSEHHHHHHNPFHLGKDSSSSASSTSAAAFSTRSLISAASSGRVCSSSVRASSSCSTSPMEPQGLRSCDCLSIEADSTTRRKPVSFLRLSRFRATSVISFSVGMPSKSGSGSQRMGSGRLTSPR